MLTLTSPFHPIRGYSSNFMVHVNQMTCTDPHCDVARREPLRATQGRVVKMWGYPFFPRARLAAWFQKYSIYFPSFLFTIPSSHIACALYCIAAWSRQGQGRWRVLQMRGTQGPTATVHASFAASFKAGTLRRSQIFLNLYFFGCLNFFLSVVTVVFPSVNICSPVCEDHTPVTFYHVIQYTCFAMNFEHAQYKAPHCIFENIPVPQQSIPCLFSPPHRIASKKKYPN